MELTDEVHRADVFGRDGRLKTCAMGTTASGRWHVEKGSLCLEREREERRCYTVWVTGTAVQLRPAGVDVPLDGILEKPRDHSH
jgi:hypothetical protein